MIIQSKQVWIAGQFLAMQLEVNDGKITDILLMVQKKRMRIMAKSVSFPVL